METPRFADFEVAERAAGCTEVLARWWEPGAHAERYGAEGASYWVDRTNA